MKKEKDIKKKTNLKKTTTTKKKDNKPKEKLGEGTKKELKLVKWPTAKEMVKNTIATIFLCLVLVAFFEVLTLLMALIKVIF